MWDDHFGSMMAVQPQTKLEKTENRPVYSDSCRAGLEAGEFKKQEINEMLAMDVNELALTEWASLIVFVFNKYVAIPFSLDYCKVNALITRDSYPILRVREYIDSLGDATNVWALYAIGG